MTITIAGFDLPTNTTTLTTAAGIYRLTDYDPRHRVAVFTFWRVL